MDSDAATSHQEQISLYGLFGDSSATLQGLNDHLSPSLLQQSPPCGNALSGHAAVTKAVIMSPPKQSITNGIQHGGMLLSDLADRSPSAGSITAASLCNYVSFGNQRCTNLVNLKGRRFCNQHSQEPTSMVKKAIFKRPPSAMNMKLLEGFLPITKSEIINRHTGRKIAQSEYNATILTATAGSNMRTTPSLTITPSMNGIDVSDNMKYTDVNDLSPQQKEQRVRLVKKVGKTITVTRKPGPLKGGDSTSSKVDLTSTAANSERPQLSQPHNSKNMVKTGSSRGLPTTYNIPYYKKLEPVTVPSQLKESRFSHNLSSPVTNLSSAQTSSALATNKSTGNDETLKKLLEVLSVKNISIQEQLSLLQSMGVTIVQAPVASANSLSKNRSHEINVDNSGVSNVNVLASACSSSPIAQAKSGLRKTEMASNIEGSKEKQPCSVKMTAGNEQGSKDTSKEAHTSDKGKKITQKGSLKRKQKQTNECPPKKSRPDGKTTNGGMTASISKKASSAKSHSEKSKAKKSPGVDVRHISLLKANARPKMVSLSSLSDSFKTLTQYLNEKTLLESDLFSDDVVEVQKTALKTDKGKALKQRLLKKHAKDKRRKNRGKSVNYEQCLEDLDSTDPFKSLAAANSLIKLFSNEGHVNRGVHHERVLKKMRTPINPSDTSYGCVSPVHDTPVDPSVDDKLAYTLDTLMMERKHKALLKELEREERELEILSRCFQENPALAIKTVNSYLGDDIIRRPVKSRNLPKSLLCQVSSDEGLKCRKRTLPYANYCKEHIWHCESQCLYKLDQNMKTVADIIPEPTVKRARKRAKLLPLIKKYKKKKKKKVDGGEQLGEGKPDSKSCDISMPKDICKEENKNGAGSPQKTVTPAGRNLFVTKNEQVLQNFDLDLSKRSESSDDDLNLMTQEIMLSGVLDKLQDDARDFDLFSEKNAEELERALLLAAGEQIDDHGSMADILTSGPDTIPNLSSGLLLSPRLNSSPDAIINCDAPKSAEPPPSLEQFNESQIAHYTFGSSMGVVKKDTQSENYPSEEAVPLLISAEDLQDIEGVLERLDAEEANSPKVHPSPSMDQYTIMLARQLSQEVEGESLKREASSSSLTTSSSQSFERSQSLSASFSLPSPSLSPASSPLSNTKPSMQYSVLSNSNPVSQTTSGQFRKPNLVKTENHAAVSAAIDVKATVLRQEALVSPPKYTMTCKATNTITTGMRQSRNQAALIANSPSAEYKVKKTKSVSSSGNAVLTESSVLRSVQGKMQQPSASVVQNQVVPVTLMHSQQPQGGNVIKVIVSPGTIINGSNGQQNMLLIPVSALMKSNLQAGGQNVLASAANVNQAGSTVGVKPQMSNLSAGQQFFILNNASANTPQTQLTLVQKPGNVNAQQSVLLKQQCASMKDRGTFVRTQLNHDQVNQRADVKSLEMQLKFGNNRLDQNGKVTTFAISTCMPSTVNNVSTQSSPYGKVTKVVAAQAGKMTAPRNPGGRRKGKNTPRKPKARFDPVTQKYVPVTDDSASSSVTSVPNSATTSSRSESLMKFNESALSLQNKVQQIDSVLSSLNAAAKSQAGMLKGHQDAVKNKSNVQTVKPMAGLSSGSGIEYKTTSNFLKLANAKSTAASTSTVVQTKAGASQSKISGTRRHSDSMAGVGGALQKQVCKSIPVVVTKSALIKESARSTAKDVSTTAISSSRVTAAATTSGTVHWNQTTTAGPDISTSSLTVPVYITGAIPANAWGGELALARSPNGTALPVILPARKGGINRQVQQRVVLGSLGPAGLTKVSTMSSGSATLLKQSVISVPHGFVTMPKAKVATATLLKDAGKTALLRGSRPANVSLSQVAMQRADVGLKQLSANTSTGNGLGSLSNAATVKATSIVASPAQLLINDEVALRKKCGRKAGNDAILVNPLVSKPSVLHQNVSSQRPSD